MDLKYVGLCSLFHKPGEIAKMSRLSQDELKSIFNITIFEEIPFIKNLLEIINKTKHMSSEQTIAQNFKISPKAFQYIISQKIIKEPDLVHQDDAIQEVASCQSCADVVKSRALKLCNANIDIQIIRALYELPHNLTFNSWLNWPDKSRKNSSKYKNIKHKKMQDRIVELRNQSYDDTKIAEELNIGIVLLRAIMGEMNRYFVFHTQEDVEYLIKKSKLENKLKVLEYVAGVSYEASKRWKRNIKFGLRISKNGFFESDDEADSKTKFLAIEKYYMDVADKKQPVMDKKISKWIRIFEYRIKKKMTFRVIKQETEWYIEDLYFDHDQISKKAFSKLKYPNLRKQKKIVKNVEINTTKFNVFKKRKPENDFDWNIIFSKISNKIKTKSMSNSQLFVTNVDKILLNSHDTILFILKEKVYNLYKLNIKNKIIKALYDLPSVIYIKSWLGWSTDCSKSKYHEKICERILNFRKFGVKDKDICQVLHINSSRLKEIVGELSRLAVFYSQNDIQNLFNSPGHLPYAKYIYKIAGVSNNTAKRWVKNAKRNTRFSKGGAFESDKEADSYTKFKSVENYYLNKGKIEDYEETDIKVLKWVQVFEKSIEMDKSRSIFEISQWHIVEMN